MLAAIRWQRPITRIYLAAGVERRFAEELTGLAGARGLEVSVVDRQWLSLRVGNESHQGVAAEAEDPRYVEPRDMLAAVPQGEQALLIALDQVQDPHNLGAVIRTAAAAGAHGLLIPSRRSAGLTAGALKAAAGAAEWFPVAQVVNLPRALDQLKQAGVWAVGADAEAGQTLWQADLNRPLVLVVGGEDRGLGRLVQQKCDILVALPMCGPVSSLNVSVAAGVLLYEVLRQRGLPADGVRRRGPRDVP